MTPQAKPKRITKAVVQQAKRNMEEAEQALNEAQTAWRDAREAYYTIYSAFIEQEGI